MISLNKEKKNIEVKLVKCSEEYWEFVRRLRTNTQVSSGFIKTDKITKHEQLVYMSKYADNYRIALLDQIPCGFVGVVNGDIRVCTHPMKVERLKVKETMKMEYSKEKKYNIMKMVSIIL